MARAGLSTLVIVFACALCVAAVAGEDRESIVAGNNAFAFDLYGNLRTKPGNLLFSPYSVSSALGMTYAGARGETAEQMARALHFTLGPEKLHSAFGALIAEQNAAEKDGKPRTYELAVANRLFGQNGYEFLPAFLDVTRKSYGSELQRLDFKADTERARSTINAWVEEKTRDKIKDLIPRGQLQSDTRLVLVNAVYFKGKWEKQFSAKQTKSAPFTGEDGQKSDAQFMQQTGDFRFLEQDGMKALEMRYTGGDLAMLALLPKDEKSLGELEKKLDSKSMTDWTSKLVEQNVIVSFPKFKMTWGTQDISSDIRSLGMNLAFNANEADFSGMNGNRELYIGLILHKAFMDVNEEGTEAAAATAVGMKAGGPPHRPPEFVADHPFICLIRDVKSGAILFMCRVAAPK